MANTGRGVMGDGSESEEAGDGTGALRAFVVGVDGTTAGTAALLWAAEQARRTGAGVVAIAVSEPRPLVAGGPGAGGGMLLPPVGPAAGLGVLDDDELNAEANRWLTEAIGALPGGAAEVVERRVVRGDAADVLLEAARDAALLVLGNHRQGAVTGALLGSVAQRCVRHAMCPLALVPAPEPSGAGD